MELGGGFAAPLSPGDDTGDISFCLVTCKYLLMYLEIVTFLDPILPCQGEKHSFTRTPGRPRGRDGSCSAFLYIFYT